MGPQRRAMVRVCAQCEADNATKRCSRCKACYYCSAECQKAAWSVHKRTNCFVAAKPLPPPPARTSGSWDSISEQQLQNCLTDTEIDRIASRDPARSTLLQAITDGVNRGKLKAFANPPQYDRFALQTLHAAG